MRLLNPVVTNVSTAMPCAFKASLLSYDALAAWFLLSLTERTTNLDLIGSDDDTLIAKVLKMDPRIWRRCRAELERHGVIIQTDEAVAA